MNAQWPSKLLGELVENGELSYGIVQPGNHFDSGVPIVRVKDLKAGRVDTSDPLRVKPDVSAKHRRTVLRGGEVLVSIVGSIGEAAVASGSLAGWNVARAIAVIRPHDVSANWVQLCLRSPSTQSILSSVLNTTVQATLNLADLKKIPIPFPPKRERDAIADVMGSIDDKIAANDRLIAAAGELACATWQKALADGTTAPLSTLARFVNGRAFTKDATGTGRVVIRIAELNSGLGNSTVYNDIDVPDDHLARPGDLLFAWSGSLTVARWFRPEAIVNQHIFKVIPREGYPLWLLNQAIHAKLQEFKAIAADKTTTMGHIQRRHLDEPAFLPCESEIARIDGLMSGLWDRALAAEQENLSLEATRDELLPLLMSGKVCVREAEKVVSDAL